MSNSKYVKIYDKERELLFKTNSVTAYEVYFHLKGDNSYFKKEFMDLTRCIAEYLNIKERTVKDVIKRLIKVGLVQVKKKGKVNYYTLPYDNIETINTGKHGETNRNEETVIQHEETEGFKEEHLGRGINESSDKSDEIRGEETEGKFKKEVEPLPNYPTYQEKRQWAEEGFSNDYIQKHWRKLRERYVS